MKSKVEAYEPGELAVVKALHNLLIGSYYSIVESHMLKKEPFLSIDMKTGKCTRKIA